MSVVADPQYEATEPMVSVFSQSGVDHPVVLPELVLPAQAQPAITHDAHTRLDDLLCVKQMQQGFKLDIIAVWLAIPLLFGLVGCAWVLFIAQFFRFFS
jgi:hypothetical protein